MHYSENPGHVRVDFFKESGKWYATEVLNMSDWYGKGFPPRKNTDDPSDSPHCVTAVRRCLLNYLSKYAEPKTNEALRFEGMTYVVLEPYHVHAHPVMGQVSELRSLTKEA